MEKKMSTTKPVKRPKNDWRKEFTRARTLSRHADESQEVVHDCAVPGPLKLLLAPRERRPEQTHNVRRGRESVNFGGEALEAAKESDLLQESPEVHWISTRRARADPLCVGRAQILPGEREIFFHESSTLVRSERVNFEDTPLAGEHNGHDGALAGAAQDKDNVQRQRLGQP